MGSRLAKSVVEWFRALAERTRAYKVAKVHQVSNAATGGSVDVLIEIVPSDGGLPRATAPPCDPSNPQSAMAAIRFIGSPPPVDCALFLKN